MNNLTGQTKLLFIKKDGHLNTVLHNCARKNTRKNKQKLKQILTLHTYIHTHRPQADLQARAHLYKLAHIHTPTPTPTMY